MSNTPKTRNARACEACRVSKARCTYKSETGICTKCEDNGGACIVRDKARPMRVRSSHPAEASKKSSTTFTKDFSLALPSIDAPDGAQDFAKLYEHHQSYFEDAEPSALHDDLPSGSMLEKRAVTLEQAEELLSTFRRNSGLFPFVTIPPEATVPSMAKKSPFLLLAILTVASATDAQLFHQINHEFRRVLSMKVIVEGRKSLEYLQGLLIYIASLVTDLGLDKKCLGLSNSPLDITGIDTVSFTSAERRAYLGCYFLSAAVANGFNKPNLIPLKNGMGLLAESLMDEEGEHMGELVSLLRLQSLCDRIRQPQTPIEASGINEIQAFNAVVNVQLFHNELQDWRNSTSSHVRNLPSVALADRFTEIEIYGHQLGFLRRPYRDYLRKTADQAVDPLHLSSCLLACKVYFEYLISLPGTTFLSFTLIQWRMFIQAIIVLSRLTFLMASNMGWDSEITLSSILMVTYMDCLCPCFKQLSSTERVGEETPENPDFFFVLTIMLEAFKRSWIKRVAKIRPEPSAFGSAHASLCPIYDPGLSTHFVTQGLSDQSSFDFGSTNACTEDSARFRKAYDSVPLYHDLWATMNCSWAET